jgi:SAM-dependent methyltransferase
MKEVLNAQQQHWQETFIRKPNMFGAEASDPARFAAELFKKGSKTSILELGGGQGRDTIFLARNGFHVHTVDYSDSAVRAIVNKAQELALSDSITALQHDVRKPLPFDDESFDGCYSHMLYCMALTTSELEFLSREVRRVLRPHGLNVYTVRHTGDAHYETGIHRGEDMYEVGGFIVHFFDREKVERLATGYEILSIDEFEEGKLPRKLFRVTLRKKGRAEVI